MSNTRIYFPYYVKTIDVYSVLKKINGASFKIKPLVFAKSFDESKPFSNTNKWYVCFTDERFKIKSASQENLLFFDFNIETPIGEKLSSLFFFDTIGNEEKFTSLDCPKTLIPECSPFWVACGKRLIDFFGGEMIVDDSQQESEYVRYVNDTPKLNYQKNDDVFFGIFQQLLKDEVLISSRDLEWAIEKTGLKESPLLCYLKKLELCDKLENELSGEKKDSVKMKI